MLQSRIPMSIAAIASLAILLQPTGAVPVAMSARHRDENEQPTFVRGSRSGKTNTGASAGGTTNRGARGSLLPHSTNSRRRLIDPMAGVTLAAGYGGSAGQLMTSVVQEMMDAVIPAAPPTPIPPPTPMPSTAPSTPIPPPLVAVPAPSNVTFLPGAMTVMEGDLILSQGLTSKIIAISGEPVRYADGTTSAIDFHYWPDGAACFPDNRPQNRGGWIYVSNLEDKKGGVGGMVFDQQGNILEYKMLLEGTRYNCNGGRTPWDTFITAEEDFDKQKGRVYQVDPYGIRQPEVITMGSQGGSFEAFAADARDQAVPRFFLTEDSVFGALERFTPISPNWNDPWTMLTGIGVHQWLLLTPDPFDYSRGTYEWTTNLDMARSNAAMHYPESEGIDVAGSTLCFVCKGVKMLFTLDLDGNTYTRASTDSGLFEGEPDMIRTILSEEEDGESLLYFTEDNGRRAGIHARNQAGELMTILEGFYAPETTGLALSPNGRFLYCCFQEDGYCFAISRTDGLSFRAKTLNVKRHSTEARTRQHRV